MFVYFFMAAVSKFNASQFLTLTLSVFSSFLAYGIGCKIFSLLFNDVYKNGEDLFQLSKPTPMIYAKLRLNNLTKLSF